MTAGTSSPHAFYERYLQRCNQHRVQTLNDFVADDVNGPAHGFRGYAADVQAVIDALPDVHWELQRLVVEDSWLAARLLTSGTHRGSFEGVEPSGRRITVQELVVYRWQEGKFVECWGDLAVVLRDELSPGQP